VRTAPVLFDTGDLESAGQVLLIADTPNGREERFEAGWE
jgi:hypothetical protein